MRTIGYLRVSTIDQNNDKFKHEILDFANQKKITPVEWIEEKISGKVSWKERKLAGILDELQEGDNLIVPEISRLGRSTLQILEILEIAKKKKINVYAIKGNWTLNGSIESKVVSWVFALVAEIERDLISIRTKEALAARKASGKPLGRPKGSFKSALDPHKEDIIKMLKMGATYRFIAKQYGFTEGGVGRWCRNNNIKKPKI
jgi:DNA invertase Pin-like site-specific DNA recombinase